MFGIRLYEEPRYDVINRVSDNVEIRRYGPRLAAEVELPAAGKAGRDEAFRLLFAYIAGANQTSGSGNAMIAMTTPVEVRDSKLLAMTTPVQASEASGMVRMQFFLPAKYSMDKAPKPRDPRVRLVAVPGETIAALRFSGSGAYFAQRQSELIGKLAGIGMAAGQRALCAQLRCPFHDTFPAPERSRGRGGGETLNLLPGACVYEL